MREVSAINSHDQLNSFLVEVFHSIMHSESQDLKALGYKDLSISELNVIEAACQLEPGGQNSARGIAQLVGVTPGTLTTAINVLEKKGYLLRSPDPYDRRRIRVSATELGRKAEQDHRRIHNRMVEGVASLLDEEEMQALLRALESISSFFSTERKIKS